MNNKIKKSLAPFIWIIISFMLVIPVKACTSFIVYDCGTYYGMNFDFPDTDLKFSIQTINQTKVFTMAFQDGDEFVTTVRMNENGLFFAEQMEYPEMRKIKALKGDQYYIGDVGLNIAGMKNTSDVLDFIKNKTLVNRNVTVHQLVADKNGNSAVLEAGETTNNIIKTKDKYQVMTNFSQMNVINKKTDEISGVGADRYKTACNLLEKSKGKISDAVGWDILNQTRQSGEWATQCSMLMNPIEKTVQISLKGSEKQIWQLDMKSGVMKTTLANGMKIKKTIDDKGVLATEMKKMLTITTTEKEPDNGFLLYSILVLGAMISGGFIFCVIKCRRTRK